MLWALNTGIAVGPVRNLTNRAPRPDTFEFTHCLGNSKTLEQAMDIHAAPNSKIGDRP
jgi:hypothetical protein